MRSIYLLCLAVLSACLVLQAFAQPPGLASCRLEWNFGQTCDDVNPALAQAIKDLSITTCPPVGELCVELHAIWQPNTVLMLTSSWFLNRISFRCKYTLFSVQKYVITASHKTPVREFVDDLAFIFNYTSDSTCNVQVR